MRRLTIILLLASSLLAACAGNPDKRTLAVLRKVEPDVSEVRLENGLDQAIDGYRKFLEEAPVSALTPEAMRRLADLELEKESGIYGEFLPGQLPTPASGGTVAPPASLAIGEDTRVATASMSESEEPVASESPALAQARSDIGLPDGREVGGRGPREAIALYDDILEGYPNYLHNDRVLYQKARAFDELGEPDRAIAVIESLIVRFPYSRHIDEVQFRRGEYFFTRKRYFDAEEAYGAVAVIGARSDFYELALHKLGWTFYKQELHEEALDQFIELLDHKVSTGYDFDQSEDEADERRIADTYRVVSLSFSNFGGSDAVEAYFEAQGPRSYEGRIYSQLGDFYLEKLRYHDASATFRAFVTLHPLDPAAPHFAMRVVEVYEAGGFPKLVLEAKKEFATTYGMGASTKGNVLLQNSKIDRNLLSGIFDVNKEKFNKFTPHSKIKIIDEKKLKKTKVDFILLLIWHFKGYIINKIKKYNKNIKIIIPFPKIKII